MLLEADIRRGLAARRSMRFIYETHQAAFSFGYIQFTKYVKALIIPADIIHDIFAQSRSAMEVMRPGAAMRSFQAVQQASTMAWYVS